MQEDINFLVTNRLPRRLLSRLMGWYSNIRSPLLTRFSIALWRRFTDLDLSDAQEHSYESLQACFTRKLKSGARPIDERGDVMVSPCDAIIGAHGRVKDQELYQVKGMPYTLTELLGCPEAVERYRNGRFVTLRLTSAMYHRFHAPTDCTISQVHYLSGDTWNVNPIALKRVERLFCRNERVALRARSTAGAEFALVAVAAILVASIRLPFIKGHFHLGYRGSEHIRCNHQFSKGDEIGWFEHGSTIVVLLPADTQLCPEITEGVAIRMGEALAERCA